jgi:deoxyribodipyrimidine photo-lyase
MSAVFLFHRDFRLIDNSALNLALKKGMKILPVFIFHPEQIEEAKNPYFSHPSVQFLCESLIELDNDLKKHNAHLHIFYGDTVKVLDSLHQAWKFQHFFSNRDFTVFAEERDAKIKDWCKKTSVTYTDSEDYDIVPSDRVLMNEGTPQARPYTVLSHYFNKFTKDVYNEKTLARRPFTELITSSLFVHERIQAKNFQLMSHDDLSKLYKKKTTIVQHGGRSHGLASMARVDEVWQKYSNDRHYPGKWDSTTRMSAHLKFGTVSIREFFYKIVDATGGSLQSDLLREVVFRSFYYKIWTHQPKLQRDRSFHQHIDDQIPWKYPKDAPTEWEAWTTGMTGFPMADAGMRQLEVEGFVHGRPRMVLATVATRYLLFDWRECARHFATRLTDYDPILNAAGWGFGCSLGENAQNVWRAPMNPLLQSRNYDPECEYIRKWIPELAKVSNKDIHDWSKKTKLKYPNVKYPAPIVDQKEASNRATNMWKNAARATDPK